MPVLWIALGLACDPLVQFDDSIEFQSNFNLQISLEFRIAYELCANITIFGLNFSKWPTDWIYEHSSSIDFNLKTVTLSFCGSH